MEEVNENLRRSLNRAIAGEIRNNQTGTMPNFDISAFSVNFGNAANVTKAPDDKKVQKHNIARKVCRLCLCSDKNLYELAHEVQVAYQHILSKDVAEKLPQKFCCECSARMTSFTLFRMKILQKNSMLISFIRPFMNLSELITTRRQHRAAGLLANPAYIIHRQTRAVPYNIPIHPEDRLPGTPSNLAFCLLQLPRRPEEPREPE